MTWNEVCQDPTLQDLPYKIELNRFGQIVMSPASNHHSRQQGRIIALLLQISETGETFPECSIQTPEGIKVADVAWCSEEFLQRHPSDKPFPAAPELCVEIVSPSNSDEEMALKRGLYFEVGAREVWFCQADGAIHFHDATGPRQASALFPDFPRSL